MSLLEQVRAGHEEIERLERLAVDALSRETHSHRERLAQGQAVAAMVDGIASRAERLRSIYADADGARKEEIAALGGGENAFSAFYERMGEVRDAHRHFPGALAATRAEADAALAEPPAVAFTGEEASGRWLDLTQLHQAFVNAPFGCVTDYLSFLGGLLSGVAGLVPRPKKSARGYAPFLADLCAYLRSFQRRAAPLSYPEPAVAARLAAFDADWAAGKVAGWEDRGLGAAAAAAAAAPAGAGGDGRPDGCVDLAPFGSAAEVGAALGADAVRAELAKLGLKQGGTEAERCARLYTTRGKALSEVDRRLFAKGRAPPPAAPAAGGGGGGGGDGAAAAAAEAAAARAEAAARSLAQAEAEADALLTLLRDTLAATRGNVEKRGAQSFEEREAERLEEEADGGADAADGDGDDVAAVYNPLKLPMGWDGKPIPYWLYKLHGLNQEFKCEICGNESYWGRRAYERHFREPKHQHGLRCLKIPNSKAFLEVTTIKDAVALAAALAEKGARAFRGDADEEFEDAQGNVYNKTTYALLQRQGLL